MKTGIRLTKGIDSKVWTALANKVGYGPEDWGVVAAVAREVGLRGESVIRWQKLSKTSYPVHQKSSLCKVAKVLGVEVPKKVEVTNRPWGSRRGKKAPATKTERLHERGILIDTKDIKNVTSPRFWQGFDLTVETAAMIQNRIEDAMLESIELRKKQVIAELKARMTSLGITTKELND